MFITDRDHHGMDLECAHRLQQQLLFILPSAHKYQLITNVVHDVLGTPRANYPCIESLRGLLILCVSELLNIPDNAVPLSLNRVDSSASGGGGAPSSSSSMGVSSHPDTGISYSHVRIAGISDPGLVLTALATALNKLGEVPSKIFGNY